MVNIQFNNVFKHFGNKAAIKDLSFDTSSYNRIVFLGTSGSGKTTSLKLINKLIQHDKGDIYLNGDTINDLNPVLLRRNIGYMIQKGGLFPHRTVRENIMTVPELINMNRKEAEERLDMLIDFVKIDKSYLGKMPDQLSGGEQQRVGIARALIGQAELVLMDEPFGALDPLTARDIRNDFLQIQSDLGFTSVLVTHNIMEAIEFGELIILLHEGELMQAGSVLDLLFTPNNSFVKQFFDENRFELELQAVKVKDIKPFISVLNGHKDKLAIRELMSVSDQRTDILNAFEMFKSDYKSRN
ncbi:ATP-binding cassette domain-containing protein [Marinigracilibium pacificum]|uniref:ABC transporter ATP-binding protein n=1 Tax=Marinigracilibium pacificum TaxID=2729599 RepID=A0A848J6A9_9BACT|nr:ABC transporter ATP-binding protein [Marinigracilibium pacificum]NMM50004.1 ABC transporter ATP-binding protein [Marinigracilibium pacificum]